MTDQATIDTGFPAACGTATDILLDWLPAYRGQPELLLFDALRSLSALGERAPLTAMAWMLDRALAEVEGPGPQASMDDMRGDAAFWADVASPRELEVYFVACLRRLMRDRGLLNTAAQKRLLVALWECLPDAERRAFLCKVDPGGTFRRAG